MKKIFIEDSDTLTTLMFKKWGYELVTDYKKADAIVFTGGSDVSPALYDEPVDPRCGNPNVARDMNCVALYNYAKANGIKCLGICRGAQFITVMQGGKLKQHISGHEYGHHDLYFQDGDSLLEDGHSLRSNSVHHQEMIPTDHIRVLAVSDSVVEVTMDTFIDDDLCVQGHPEYEHTDHEFQQWYMKTVELLL